MTIEDEIEALGPMDLEGLRADWRMRYGEPPRLRSVDLLRRILAWRIQATALGGIDAGLRRRLEQTRDGLEHRLESGMRLCRDWQGVRHEVEVAAEGFIHDGRRYGSLSQVARAITGTRWNGPRFFGLREVAAR